MLSGGTVAGPSQATFLKDDLQAWNLAFLSHAYEKRAEHPDPKFTIHVRRSVNTTLHSGAVSLTGI